MILRAARFLLEVDWSLKRFLVLQKPLNQLSHLDLRLGLEISSGMVGLVQTQGESQSRRSQVF